MTEKTTTIFSCDFCKKKYFAKRWAIYHEKICMKNPENKRLCYDCEYLTKKTLNRDDSEYPVLEIFYCDKKQIGLYPSQSEIRNNILDLGDYENVEMMKECEEFKKHEFLVDMDLFKI